MVKNSSQPVDRPKEPFNSEAPAIDLIQICQCQEIIPYISHTDKTIHRVNMPREAIAALNPD
jgi:hypothetical protein